jgi:hypothetical protein
MSASMEDTDWALSLKGNQWRRVAGKLVVVGTRDQKRYWARVGDDFLRGNYYSITEAKQAAECAALSNSEDAPGYFDNWWDDV